MFPLLFTIFKPLEGVENTGENPCKWLHLLVKSQKKSGKDCEKMMKRW
jgi:hypothetical protein